MGIFENARAIIEEVKGRAIIVAASKTRTVDELVEAWRAGIRIFGENYVQEAAPKIEALKNNPEVSAGLEWHMIGHLQKNKVSRAVALFDMIQTVDSFELALAIDRAASRQGKILRVLFEINSGCEVQKSGIRPEEAIELVKKASTLKHISIEGLMTMGPLVDEPEKVRPYFRITRELFEELSSMNLPGVRMKYLSMGMSDTWRVAIEEKATMVRIGTALFGPRSRC